MERGQAWRSLITAASGFQITRAAEGERDIVIWQLRHVAAPIAGEEAFNALKRQRDL